MFWNCFKFIFYAHYSHFWKHFLYLLDNFFSKMTVMSVKYELKTMDVQMYQQLSCWLVNICIYIYKFYDHYCHFENFFSQISKIWFIMVLTDIVEKVTTRLVHSKILLSLQSFWKLFFFLNRSLIFYGPYIHCWKSYNSIGLK